MTNRASIDRNKSSHMTKIENDKNTIIQIKRSHSELIKT